MHSRNKSCKPRALKLGFDLNSRSVLNLSGPDASQPNIPICDDFVDLLGNEEVTEIIQKFAEVLKETRPLIGTVRGDFVEFYLIGADGTPKLFAQGYPEGLNGEFGMGGNA